MYFLAFLQFFLVALIAALVLFQRSEDSISDFASSRPSASGMSSLSPLCKITWFCFFAFLINSVLLSAMYRPSVGGGGILDDSVQQHNESYFDKKESEPDSNPEELPTVNN